MEPYCRCPRRLSACRCRGHFHGVQHRRKQIPSNLGDQVQMAHRLHPSHPHACRIRQREMETVSAALLNERQYRKLLDVALPVAIRTEEEYHRLLGAAAALMEKPEDKMSEEEGRLLELLSLVIDEFETRAHPLPKGKPHKMLAYILAVKDMKPS